MWLHAVLFGLCLCTRATAFAHPSASSISAAARLLELSLPSSHSAVRQAYRRKAAECHPDVRQNPVAVDEFIRVTAAYELLQEPSVLAVWRLWDQSQSPAAAPSPAAHCEVGCACYAHGQRDDRTSSAAWGGDGSEKHSRRVSAWRVYWQAAVLASQAESEVQAIRHKLASTMHEVEGIRAQLSRPAAQPQPPPERAQLHARLLCANARLAQLQDEEQPSSDRARALRYRSQELERLAVNVV